MRRVALLLSFVVWTAGFAPAPLPRPERRPSPPNFEGLWEGGMSSDGRLPQLAQPQKVLITRDRMTYHPDTKPFVYRLRVDTSVRPVRFYVQDVAEMGKQARWAPGIWRVEGDVLTLTYYTGNDDRCPTAFEGPGKGTVVEVYRRVRR